MKIAVDLDGVCYEWSKTVRYMMRAYRGHGMSGPMGQESTSWNYIQENVSKDDWRWLWKWGVGLGLFRYGHMIAGTRMGLQTLAGQGHDLEIVSHRPKAAINDTVDWISLYFKDIPLVGIQLLTQEESKADHSDADLLIDDKPENVIAWAATGRDVLLFDQPWNQAVQPDHRISRVFGWRGVTGAVEILEAVRMGD